MNGVDQPRQRLEEKSSLQVVASGLCCSLGYHLDAALHAMHANMDHFQESKFCGPSSTPVNVAMLADEVYGPERLQRWISFVVRDCATQLASGCSLFDIHKTAIVVLGPDIARAHADSADLAESTNKVMAQLRDESDVDASSTPIPHEQRNLSVIMHGRTGLTEGLLRSARYLVNEEAEQVLLIGVDSYLNAADMNAFLDDKRLLIRGNSDGFIPGEAAAAVVLRAATPATPGLHIKGVGAGQEPGRWDGSAPSRSQGLSDAIRAACAQAKIAPTDVEFRLSDQNGEQFYSNDAANAMTRVMFGGSALANLTLADKIGEVGAAVGPAMLAWLHRDMADPLYSPGNTGLVHLANDNGARSAVILRHFGE